MWSLRKWWSRLPAPRWNRRQFQAIRGENMRRTRLQAGSPVQRKTRSCVGSRMIAFPSCASDSNRGYRRIYIVIMRKRLRFQGRDCAVPQGRLPWLLEGMSLERSGSRSRSVSTPLHGLITVPRRRSHSRKRTKLLRKSQSHHRWPHFFNYPYFGRVWRRKGSSSEKNGPGRRLLREKILGRGIT